MDKEPSLWSSGSTIVFCASSRSNPACCIIRFQGQTLPFASSAIHQHQIPMALPLGTEFGGLPSAIRSIRDSARPDSRVASTYAVMFPLCGNSTAGRGVGALDSNLNPPNRAVNRGNYGSFPIRRFQAFKKGTGTVPLPSCDDNGASPRKSRASLRGQTLPLASFADTDIKCPWPAL